MPKKKKIKIVNEDHDEIEILPSEQDQDDSLEEEIIDEEDFEEDEEDEINVEDALVDDSIPTEEKLELVKTACELKAAEYLDGWQRQQAEFANYKKRVNRDREQYNKDAVGKVAKKYLPILDDLERALKEKPTSEAHETWINGIDLIYRKFVTALESDGIYPMKIGNDMFDPNKHEAVAQVPSDDHESGHIVEVIETGYTIGDRVLRPAKVCIAT
jgi:molecular chaperone GrpE